MNSDTCIYLIKSVYIQHEYKKSLTNNTNLNSDIHMKIFKSFLSRKPLFIYNFTTADSGMRIGKYKTSQYFMYELYICIQTVFHIMM